MEQGEPGHDVAPPRSGWRKTLDEIKLRRGCEDQRCAGYPRGYPRVLSFDHRPEPGVVKLFEISQAIRGQGRTGRLVRPGAGGVNTIETITWPVILAEIEKCDVVCKNCHEVRNTERDQGRAGAQPS
jgi:hypothetical protein